jgi:hypothetical protein
LGTCRWLVKDSPIASRNGSTMKIAISTKAGDTTTTALRVSPVRRLLIPATVRATWNETVPEHWPLRQHSGTPPKKDDYFLPNGG